MPTGYSFLQYLATPGAFTSSLLGPQYDLGCQSFFLRFSLPLAFSNPCMPEFRGSLCPCSCPFPNSGLLLVVTPDGLVVKARDSCLPWFILSLTLVLYSWTVGMGLPSYARSWRGKEFPDHPPSLPLLISFCSVTVKDPEPKGISCFLARRRALASTFPPESVFSLLWAFTTHAKHFISDTFGHQICWGGDFHNKQFSMTSVGCPTI